MGFTRDELEAARGRSVPDLAGDDVRLLFVGINPGLWTAAAQAHFARPGNRFFKALHKAGITGWALDPRDGFDPDERAELEGRGVAITNLVNRATARADELDPSEYVEGARALDRKIADWRPAVVAFVGLGAYRAAYGRPRSGVGRQPDHRIAGAQVWALPNPSGLNAHYQVGALAALYREAAVAAGVPLDPVRI
ncbi:MAG TPA: mismatch-specific DNA-glycosylase [Gemmatimonadota bacterium]|nr:mismatch-specific DNA-glycosylase [Gemmatimonadota bacterium]